MLDKEIITDTKKVDELKGLVERMLTIVGEDVSRDGLLKTP